ncbi:protealysin inhibitor emfourin [Nocardioides sp. Root140]|uniref:protealysin inhibitor emfourin n=1 Tax=Nocardioides sp. Root140 TaxID=1736460 RepID=UPI0006F6AF7D|nr:protealysin inhibitor emfourin [Nocardioides sp. Root140]KQY50981.1 peptidase M4 [Nocardioides sp. Root140]
MSCSIVPPYLLRQIASEPDARATDHCHRTLEIDERFRAGRRAPRAVAAADGGFTVHTADNGTDLPGRAVRASGEPASGDVAVDEAYAGLEASLAMYADVYAHNSWDGQGAHVLATVHYERNYDNAFWNGTQLVFGDGDGEVFDRFTKPVDVLAHELTHAVTESIAGLVYEGQSGALNESVSDVFGACLKQRVLGQGAAEADWVVGEGLFLPGVNGRGLRDMHNPGTAYDDPVLGKDPQGADMSAYVETTDDNGGVHLNSGIPNRAFVLAALAIGGTSAEGAGRIWWTALGTVASDVDFAGFAAATVEAAGDHADAVRDAWAQVGVEVAQPAGDAAGGATADDVAAFGGRAGRGTSPESRDHSAEAAPTVVEVRRTGGFAGRTATGRCDLGGEGAHLDEVRALLSRVDLRPAKPARTYPDMYSYVIRVDDDEVTLAETQLTDDLRRLTSLVLEQTPDVS